MYVNQSGLFSDVFFFKLYFGLFQANEIINIKVRAENTMFPFFFFWDK